ncbi:Fungal chitosanase [Penicillium italicum]|uniref:Endo-chitosanase n=1 Tax=Penicillium italicum TaxID=40296 RepID=A0A0A2KX94_PENIT|nr:Fungal chitosanase [Penicillium italicum]
MMTYSRSIPFALLALFGSTTLAQSVDGAQYNKPDGGPPGSYFAAGSSIPVAALHSAAAQASDAVPGGTYPINGDEGAKRVTIHRDWANFDEGAAFVFVADMDVDCDGLDYRCKGNPDGQDETNFGALAAYEVPFYVVPDRFGHTFRNVLPGNNVGAIICDGKMFYGIFGDTDADTPQVIGEASWLMARTCFPDEDLNGNSGHGAPDVTYIVFTGKDAVLPSSAVTEKYITNFTTLRALGDKLVTALAKNLNLSGGSDSGSGSTAPPATCEWEGHCEGASCKYGSDCSGQLVCKRGKCAPV